MFIAQIQNDANMWAAVMAVCAAATAIIGPIVGVIMRKLDMTELLKKNAAQDAVVAANKEEVQKLRDDNTACMEAHEKMRAKSDKHEAKIGQLEKHHNECEEERKDLQQRLLEVKTQLVESKKRHK